jgi:hypothetical protein
MNDELLDLIRRTGYLSDAPLTDQARYDLLTSSFWRRAASLGYDITTLKTKLWRAAGRPEKALVAILPEARIQKAVNASSKEKDPRKRIKQAALALALLYKKGEKEIRQAIDENLEDPYRMRAETDRIRRGLLMNAASWLGITVPSLYLAGSRKKVLLGPHEKAAQAMAVQEYNRFQEADAQLSRHIEEIIAEAEKRRIQAALSQSKAKVDYTGLKGRVVAHKTIDGKELGLANYIMMVALTAARNVFNQGVENEIREKGSDLAMISREVRVNSCDSCRKWAGKIISITGDTTGYPSYEDAKAARVFHIHCIHYLISLDAEGAKNGI